MKTLPRLVGAALAGRLRVMPAVVLTGARQTGKSTLVERLVQGERRYRSLDDFDVLDAAAGRGESDASAAAGRLRAFALLSRRVWREGTFGTAAAYRHYARMAGAGRAGRAVVARAVKKDP
jgi:hypothetical protein